jgi:hypothetical protein
MMLRISIADVVASMTAAEMVLAEKYIKIRRFYYDELANQAMPRIGETLAQFYRRIKSITGCSIGDASFIYSHYKPKS